MESTDDAVLIETRIELLESFHKALGRWFNNDYAPEGKDALRSFINRNLIAVRNAVLEAGTLNLIRITPPPSIGGFPLERTILDPVRAGLRISATLHARAMLPARLRGLSASSISDTCPSPASER